MLSAEALAAYASGLGMPEGKLRGAVREYLQVLILKSLYSRPRSDALVFLGGTALRLGHDLPRFSEDLDFDTARMDLAAWRDLLEGTAADLRRTGLRVEVRTSEKGTLLSGDFRFAGFLQAYGLTANHRDKLRIKLEANRPEYALAVEPRAIARFGEVVAVPFASPGLASAEKILALLARGLGRDVFDLFQMAARRWVPDAGVLAARGVKGSPVTAVIGWLQRTPEARLAALARQLEPFLFDPAQAGLVARAKILLPSTLAYLEEVPPWKR